jgi:protoheme IX farnesyltransferase
MEIKKYLELCKVRQALFTSCSAGAGYLLATSHFGVEIILLVIGVFLLSSGASALNQYQEQDSDTLMMRTRKRPLPSRRISAQNGLNFSCFVILSGLLILLLTGKLVPVFLGVFALVFYNGIYTPLKRITAFAAVPGALIGAIPPAIGWSTGGRGLAEPGLIALCFFFFMWQIPHFWLLLLSHRKDYLSVSVPSLVMVFSEQQLSRITFAWLCSTAVACLLIPLFGIGSSPAVHISLISASAWLVFNGVKLLKKAGREMFYLSAFRRINIFAIIVLSVLSLDRILF